MRSPGLQCKGYSSKKGCSEQHPLTRGWQNRWLVRMQGLVWLAGNVPNHAYMNARFWSDSFSVLVDILKRLRAESLLRRMCDVCLYVRLQWSVQFAPLFWNEATEKLVSISLSSGYEFANERWLNQCFALTLGFDGIDIVLNRLFDLWCWVEVSLRIWRKVLEGGWWATWLIIAWIGVNARLKV